MDNRVTVNGSETPVDLPSTLEEFLITQDLPPRSVVIELKGEAIVSSEITTRKLQADDRLEIVRIVAGG